MFALYYTMSLSYKCPFVMNPLILSKRIEVDPKLRERVIRGWEYLGPNMHRKARARVDFGICGERPASKWGVDIVKRQSHYFACRRIAIASS